MLSLLSVEAKAELLQLIDSRINERLSTTGSPGAESPLLTVAEAAEYLRTTPAALYKRIKRKQLPHYRPEGSRILLRREDLEPGLDLKQRRSYDGEETNKWPREGGTSGAVTPGGQS